MNLANLENKERLEILKKINASVDKKAACSNEGIKLTQYYYYRKREEIKKQKKAADRKMMTEAQDKNLSSISSVDPLELKSLCNVLDNRLNMVTTAINTIIREKKSERTEFYLLRDQVSRLKREIVDLEKPRDSFFDKLKKFFTLSPPGKMPHGQ